MVARIQEKFFDRVVQLPWTTCHEWTGPLARGRAVCHFGSDRPVTAARVSYEIANGPIPSGKMICHTCDNPRCVNPAHLYAGTHADNFRDAVERGRNKLIRRPALRDVCLRGHPFAGENLYMWRGQKRCKACNAHHCKELYRRSKSTKTAGAGGPSA